MSEAVYAVWDVESTGINVLEDRVVQFFGATADKEGNLIDTLEVFINPGVPVPKEAADVHGFTDEFLVEHGKTPAEAFPLILQWFRDHFGLIQIGFNVAYDTSILHAEFVRHGVSDSWGPAMRDKARMVDGLVIDRAKDKYRKGPRRLSFMADHYGIPYESDALHNARADVELTAKVTVAILNKYGTPSNAEQASFHKAWADNFREYLTKQGKDASDVSGDWPLRTR